MKAETDEPLLERMRNDAARENFILYAVDAYIEYDLRSEC